VPIRWILARDPLGKFKSQALLCTNQEERAQQVLEWLVYRWQMEVTFEEARRHLGLETQRQWSDLAIARTTPLILGLFSLVTLLAHHLQANFTWTTRQKSWYVKSFLLNIKQPEAFNLMTGKYHRFSEGRLFNFLNKLEQKIVIHITQHNIGELLIDVALEK
jgi:predicted XRE-type DNA-binding protein